MVRATGIKAALAAALAASAVACGGGQSAPPPAATTAPPAPRVLTAEERAKWYQDCWDDFSNKSWDAFKSCYADNIESETIDAGRPVLKGPDAVVADAKSFTDAFPDTKGTAQMIFVNGNTVVGVYLLSGTHTGPLQGPGGKPIAATNKKIGYLVAHVIETDPTTNKGIREYMYGDDATFMAQLGMNPAPARPVMQSGAATPIIVSSSGSDTEAKNVEAYKAGTDAFSKHDLKALDAMNAPDGIFHDMTQPKDMNAKQNSDMAAMFWKGFPDGHLNVMSVFGAGDYTVARGTFEGTNSGAIPAMGIKKATGKPVKSQFVEIVKWENGKTKEDWLFFNSAGFASQLGLGGAPPAN